MKKAYTLLTISLLAILFNTAGNSQPIFKEDFSYIAETNFGGHGGWACSMGNHPIKVTSPGLSYPCYSGSNIGNAITLTALTDRKSTRLNSSHLGISYAVF